MMYRTFFGICSVTMGILLYAVYTERAVVYSNLAPGEWWVLAAGELVLTTTLLFSLCYTARGKPSK